SLLRGAAGGVPGVGGGPPRRTQPDRTRVRGRQRGGGAAARARRTGQGAPSACRGRGYGQAAEAAWPPLAHRVNPGARTRGDRRRDGLVGERGPRGCEQGCSEGGGEGEGGKSSGEGGKSSGPYLRLASARRAFLGRAGSAPGPGAPPGSRSPAHR